MRHIQYNPEDIIPAEWLEKAKELRVALIKADPGDRSKIIDDNEALWKELKSHLSKLTCNKCWYTEAPLDGTDSDVDHFRPKNKVEGVKKTDTKEEHPGYWWLAFDPSNYRLSCIYANRRRKDLISGRIGGKGASFPLWDEGRRAWCPDDKYEEEQTLLIDPCKAEEVSLITFAENGEAIEKYKETDDEFLFKKAQTSITLFSINNSAFCSRRQTIRARIKKFINDAIFYYDRLEFNDPQINHAFARAIEEITELCSDKIPYSGFAISILDSYRKQESLQKLFSLIPKI